MTSMVKGIRFRMQDIADKLMAAVVAIVVGAFLFGLPLFLVGSAYYSETRLSAADIAQLSPCQKQALYEMARQRPETVSLVHLDLDKANDICAKKEQETLLKKPQQEEK